MAIGPSELSTSSQKRKSGIKGFFQKIIFEVFLIIGVIVNMFVIEQSFADSYMDLYKSIDRVKTKIVLITK
jgi:membrane-bound acyltransferase YfiQ involved in biofilm formation